MRTTALLLLLAGCGEPFRSADPLEDARSWAVEDSWIEVELASVSDPLLRLSDVRGVAVDSKGRIHVVDALEGGVIVLSPGLRHLHTVGRAGMGPGEFELKQIQILPGDTLFVFDARLQRVTIIEPDDFEVVDVFPQPNWRHGPVTNLWRLADRGRSLALVRRPFYAGEDETADQGRTDAILAIEEGEEAAPDTILVAPSREFLVARGPGSVAVGTHPFGREPFIRLIGRDRFVYANSGALDVSIVDFTGSTVHSFSFATVAMPVTSEQLASEAKRTSGGLADVLRQGDPYVWPALAGLVVDEQGRIWVGVRGHQDELEWEWAAFTQDGAHAGSVRLPAGQVVEAARDDRLYAVAHDSMDVPRIRAYQLRQERAGS
ncbi:MAG: hypothetical protein OXR82_10960 [Gammaproteobacteria bacterium]|nr:hypothetical protein [Gammaproteobacteria bacterium]MDE0258885.1 hypothetical protein [Gammaproteobacteria bacterium]